MHRELKWGNLKERKHFKDLGVEGKIIIKWIIRNLLVGRRLD
jgi:hypothetical protein